MRGGNYELKELNLSLIGEIYDMYQDIPSGENGQKNKAFGLSKSEFQKYIVDQIARKNNVVNYYDTPTITYIMYVNNYPVGYICLRVNIDDNWKKWSGNFYYAIRRSEREKGYATKMLSLGLEELKKRGFKEVLGQSSKGNIASAKVI